MSFSADIKKFIKKSGDNADFVTKQVVMEIMSAIDYRSPVGNPDLWADWEKGGAGKNQEHWLVKAGFVGAGYTGGHFRANWQLGVDKMPKDEIEGHDYEGALAREIVKIPEHAAGHVYNYANNVPYAQALEDGHSKLQAPGPYAIVGKTEIEFQDKVQEALRGLK